MSNNCEKLEDIDRTGRGGKQCFVPEKPLLINTSIKPLTPSYRTECVEVSKNWTILNPQIYVIVNEFF